MAQIIINIPTDAQLSRVVDAYTLHYGWTSDLGVSKAAFTKQQVIKQIKQTVKTVEGDTAANAQRSTIDSDIESINIT